MVLFEGRWRFLAHQGLQLGTQLSTLAAAVTQLTQLAPNQDPTGPGIAGGRAVGGTHRTPEGGGTQGGAPPGARGGKRKRGGAATRNWVAAPPLVGCYVMDVGPPVSPVRVVYTSRVISSHSTLSSRVPYGRN